MKILFLSAWYPNRYDPMPGLFVKQHAEVVASQHDVAVLYVHPCNIVEKEIVCQNIKGVFTTAVYYPSGANYRWGNQIFVKAFLFLKAFYVGYKTILAGFGKPDLIHANILTRVGVVAWLLKIITSVPYVITEHWSRYLPSRNEYKDS
ncbi:MAG: glycosyltransferase family 4 protein [Bacteroidales bacterium]|nr:glycosyltransferase family 4 protein [Bacteroidales bacterium]